MRPAERQVWALVQRHVFPEKDDPVSFYERTRWAMALAQILEAPHGVVVEIGSGYGVGTRCLSMADGVGFAIGVDADADLLARSRRPDDIAQFVAADVEGTLPFRASSVDCILAPEVYEHLYHPERFLKEAYRVLRPGCPLVLTTPNTESLVLMVLRRLPRPWAQRILTREGRAKANLHPEFFGDLEAGSPHGHRIEGASLTDMERMAATYGFHQVRGTTWGLPFSAGFWGRLPRSVREFIVRRFLAMGIGLRHIFIVWQRDERPSSRAIEASRT